MLFRSLASGAVQAHGQTPYSYGGVDSFGLVKPEAKVFHEVATVRVKVINAYDTSQIYKITSDGRLYKTISIGANSSKYIRVPVVMNKPNTPELHKVCSTLKGSTGQFMSSRFCTKTRLYWIKL